MAISSFPVAGEALMSAKAISDRVTPSTVWLGPHGCDCYVWLQRLVSEGQCVCMRMCVCRLGILWLETKSWLGGVVCREKIPGVHPCPGLL